jgi:hypothetical protein
LLPFGQDFFPFQQVKERLARMGLKPGGRNDKQGKRWKVSCVTSRN